MSEVTFLVLNYGPYLVSGTDKMTGHSGLRVQLIEGVMDHVSREGGFPNSAELIYKEKSIRQLQFRCDFMGNRPGNPGRHIFSINEVLPEEYRPLVEAGELFLRISNAT